MSLALTIGECIALFQPELSFGKGEQIACTTASNSLGRLALMASYLLGKFSVYSRNLFTAQSIKLGFSNDLEFARIGCRVQLCDFGNTRA
jgi:hypothetical protein